ncbi:MAG: SDR family oxidoreductase [Halieaceae bacterium]|nr:SDR family oxidoreductase [Halieaceae bacterium]
MKVVLVTGSNSGFGLNGALAFARNGYRVYAAMRDQSKGNLLRRLASDEGLEIRTETLDTSQPSTFVECINRINSESGGIDVVVNNAGISRAGVLEDTSEETLRTVMETNYFGPVLLSKTLLPSMRERRTGHIIMVSSLSGLAGLPCDFSYTSSKFALEGATEAMRHEVDRWGIKVSLVEAGMYATNLLGERKDGEESIFPHYYDKESPYRDLMEYKWRRTKDRLPDAFDPKVVGDLFVKIANSSGKRFRWTADPVAKNVVSELHGHDDISRDHYLRKISDTDWWSEGKALPTELEG